MLRCKMAESVWKASAEIRRTKCLETLSMTKNVRQMVRKSGEISLTKFFRWYHPAVNSLGAIPLERCPNFP
jgi:hypothetical protein